MPPTCALYATTGLDCPLCGGTRAVQALARGDVAAALDHNLLLFVALPFLAWAALHWLSRRTGRALPAAPTRRAWFWALGAVGAFFVARNLPLEPFTFLDARQL